MRQGERWHWTRSTPHKLGTALAALCLSFPTWLLRSKFFLWGSCRPPGKPRRRGLWGQGMQPPPSPGVWWGETGPSRQDPGVQAMVGAQPASLGGEGKEKGVCQGKTSSSRWRLLAPAPTSVWGTQPISRPLGAPRWVWGVVNSCTWEAQGWPGLSKCPPPQLGAPQNKHWLWDRRGRLCMLCRGWGAGSWGLRCCLTPVT